MRAKIIAVVGVLILVMLVTQLPWERRSSGLTQILYSWSDQQRETSDELTEFAVSGAEGTLVGEHEVDGSNWSIPNILRHWFGG